MSDLKSSLTALAERGDPIGSERLRERIVMDLLEQSAQRPAREIRPVWAAIAAAVAVLLVVGGIPWLLGALGDGEPVAERAPTSTVPATTVPPTPTTQAAPITTTATPTTVPVAVPPPQTMWERIDDDALVGGGIYAIASNDDVIVAGGDVYDVVAAGGEYDRSDPGSLKNEYKEGVVWVSQDGRSWDRIDDRVVFGGEGFQVLWDVITGPLGFVASGQDGADAALWFSPDGYDWEKVLVDDLGTPGAVDRLAVVADGPGWVAIDDDDHPGDTVFVSADGYEWARIEDTVAASGFTDILEANQEPVPITVPRSEGVFWDFTWDGNRVIGVARFEGVYIWLSEDSGATWHRVDPEQEVFEYGWPLPQSLGVTVFGSEIIVGGNAQDDAAIWIGQWEELSQ